MSDHHLFVECPGSNKLVMFFTATGAKPGLFNWWAVGHQLAESANVLFVNGWSNTWDQDGVKGLGDGLEETLDPEKMRDLVEFLRRGLVGLGR